MHRPEGTVRYGEAVPEDEPFASRWGGLDPVVAEEQSRPGQGQGDFDPQAMDRRTTPRNSTVAEA
jgi:hypothetical protein